MEYRIIQILNLEDENGVSKMAYLPTIIQSSDIKAISPLMSKKGVIFKNVSLIETHGNEHYTVLENYNSLQERRRAFKIKGFGK